MPLIWTHILFSEEVIDRTEEMVNFTLDEDYLILGAQGDNLLDFMPFWSDNKLTSHNSSQALIAKNSEETLIKLIKANAYTNKKVASYLIGYVTHCFLESEIKKYIEFLVNYTEINKPSIKTAIDTLLMHHYHNLNTRKVPVLKALKLGWHLDKDIKKSMQCINPHLAKNFSKAYLHTLISLKWLFDPNGWKSKLFPSYRPLFDNYLKLNDNHNYLNEKHLIWDETNLDARSFVDLYDHALLQARQFLSYLMIFLEKDDDENFKAVTGLLKKLNKKVN